MLGLVKVATRPGSLRASLAGARRTPSRLRRPGPPGGARRRGWWRLPDEAAQSAGSEPFEVRVLPEGCPVAGRPGAGAVRLPQQAPKKSRYTLALVRGNNDILKAEFLEPAHGARVILAPVQRRRAQRHVAAQRTISRPHTKRRGANGAAARRRGSPRRRSLSKAAAAEACAAAPPQQRPHAAGPHTAARGGRARGLPQLGTRAPR